ncbi:hypothetical protein GCM10010211_73670 [Streptomyces albospinus]|uniref:Uncharacterized protein n=1 Tax=Streptomyces albospinus TaxID=285515 RepID=A0ABQ2VNJ0_9ACTN|nr:hypothetical protein GCM10010211_73670 [Streptomyces albospinus]
MPTSDFIAIRSAVVSVDDVRYRQRSQRRSSTVPVSAEANQMVKSVVKGAFLVLRGMDSRVTTTPQSARFTTNEGN